MNADPFYDFPVFASLLIFIKVPAEPCVNYVGSFSAEMGDVVDFSLGGGAVII